MKINDIFPLSIGHIRWKMPRQSDGYVSVTIDVAKLDASWQHDRGFYITQGGGGDSIAKRYSRFGDWLSNTDEPIEMPEVGLNSWRDCISFGNGRHRFAWLRDHGVKTLPVCVATEQAAEIEKRFGATKQILRPQKTS